MKKNKESDSKNPSPKPNLETLFLDNAQMKQIFKVSDSTLLRWRKAKIIYFKKIGGKYYYPYDLVMNFMRSGMNY